MQNFLFKKFHCQAGTHLVGYSFGGLLANEIATIMSTFEFPYSLTLLDPAPYKFSRNVKIGLPSQATVIDTLL
jgi:hypothetical protein